MPAGDEARIVVTFDTGPARAELARLGAQGQATAAQVGGGAAGAAGGGGATGGGGGTAAGARGAAGGAAAARAGGRGAAAAGGAGGAAQAAAGVARTLGIRGLGPAALAAAAMSPYIAIGGAAASTAMGRATQGGAAIGQAWGTMIAPAIERFFLGDVGIQARADMQALQQTEQSFAFLAGDENYDIGGAQNFFNTIQARRERIERGRARLQSDIQMVSRENTGDVMETPGFKAVFGLLGQAVNEIRKVAKNTEGMNK